VLFFLSTTLWRRIGEWRYSFTHSLTSTLYGGEWSASRPGRFTPRERAPGSHWIGGWVSPRAVMDAVVKRKIPSPSRESNPTTPIVQPVAQRYTDWAITVLYPISCIHKLFKTLVNIRIPSISSSGTGLMRYTATIFVCFQFLLYETHAYLNILDAFLKDRV
jgi:hypothetical protein